MGYNSCRLLQTMDSKIRHALLWGAAGLHRSGCWLQEKDEATTCHSIAFEPVP